ncbi:MAG: VOC family protein [Saprospiraceae bacterium]
MTKLRFPLQICALMACLGCQQTTPSSVDHQSYQLGVIGGFSELVNAGTKQLALSEPLPSAEMEALFPAAEKIAKRNGVELFREPDLLVTDLFPATVAQDKEVLLIYKGHTKEAYLQLKADQQALIAAGQYEGKAREAIARRFGRLLSYPPHRINELLAQNTSFRTLSDFGIQASNVFLYYQDLERATNFYANTLGLEMLADYGMATIFRVAASSYLILVDADKGMHNAQEPKTVALALLTEQLADWYAYLKAQQVPIKYDYKSKPGSAHDGFVAIDPEGYLLEFETFKQHPENERFLPILAKNETLFAQKTATNVPAGLGFNGSITWLYYKDVLAMQGFYEETLGLELIVDQGWAKIYKLTDTGFIGLVDERRGMHAFTEEKAVTLSFFIKEVEAWFDYVKTKQSFALRSTQVEEGPEAKYRAFVGYDPEGYFLEFDTFLPHAQNERLLQYLGQ